LQKNGAQFRRALLRSNAGNGEKPCSSEDDSYADLARAAHGNTKYYTLGIVRFEDCPICQSSNSAKSHKLRSTPEVAAEYRY
jgi:hypothetical protein